MNTRGCRSNARAYRSNDGYVGAIAGCRSNARTCRSNARACRSNARTCRSNAGFVGVLLGPILCRNNKTSYVLTMSGFVGVIAGPVRAMPWSV